MRQDLQNSSSQATPSTQAGRGDAQQPHTIPPVDVFEDESAITLLADLPGVARDQLQVRVDGDSLVLEAAAATAGPENMELVYGEARIPRFRRQFTLSRELDTARIGAELRDGVLRLTIPKAEEARPRRIQVQVG